MHGSGITELMSLTIAVHMETAGDIVSRCNLGGRRVAVVALRVLDEDFLGRMVSEEGRFESNAHHTLTIHPS